MALELVGGAVLGAAVAELLKEVIDAKNKAANFQTILQRLESTLRSVVPRINEIARLNLKLDLPHEEMKELITVLKNGQALIYRCSKISSINLVRKKQYSKQLVELDGSLLRYFQTILPLDHFRNDMEVLVMVKQLHMKLVGDDDKDVEICNQSGTNNPKDSGSGVLQKPMEIYHRSTKEEPAKFYKGSNKEEAMKTSPKDEELKDFQSLFLFKDTIDLFNLGSPAGALGKGTYGTTYRANTKSGGLMIVKKLKGVQVEEREFKQLIEDLRKAQHPNTMPPSGYYFDNYEVLLLYEYEAEDSLFAVLHGSGAVGMSVLSWKTRMKISLGVARGVSHLHSVKLVHRNIKSSNVLLTQDLHCSISDFGLNSIINLPANTYQNPGYYAPEFIRTQEATQKSDVFSFGILLLEILTRRRPDFVHLPSWVHSTGQDELHWPSKVFDKKLLGYQTCVREMVQMMELAMQCVEEDPNRRPEADVVVRTIENILAWVELKDLLLANLKIPKV